MLALLKNVRMLIITFERARGMRVESDFVSIVRKLSDEKFKVGKHKRAVWAK